MYGHMIVRLQEDSKRMPGEGVEGDAARALLGAAQIFFMIFLCGWATLY